MWKHLSASLSNAWYSPKTFRALPFKLLSAARLVEQLERQQQINPSSFSAHTPWSKSAMPRRRIHCNPLEAKAGLIPFSIVSQLSSEFSPHNWSIHSQSTCNLCTFSILNATHIDASDVIQRLLGFVQVNCTSVLLIWCDSWLGTWKCYGQHESLIQQEATIQWISSAGEEPTWKMSNFHTNCHFHTSSNFYSPLV